MSPSSRRAWIEISNPRARRTAGLSPSSRRAWIEIPLADGGRINLAVALLAEGVDRNLSAPSHPYTWWRVALLAEGVDRNFALVVFDGAANMSPSSRRAWIEIGR